ncbi:hypothetical protein SAY87_017464 [Trapa incisa]|uniref:TPX2 central domain-containing protein n=1 Tax=Trapa incisa TaxID=236973 RepID=A0AAN7LAA0_9MYRT|nr:hypothetical protein SAY87_017464 [Trapa incisa]
MDGFYGAQVSSLEEYDPDYEFDAPHHYDFFRMETDGEIEDAERWFHAAGTNSPSSKINWAKMHPKVHKEEANHRQMDSTMNMDCTMGPETPSDCTMGSETPSSVQYSTVEETRVLSKKSGAKPTSSLTRTSTLMKPTISHLAKLRACQETQFSSLLRSQKFPGKDQDMTWQNSSIIDKSPSKRQKLEAGYLRKVADLKHRPVLQHKLSKKLTVPREPHLETARRALFHRSKHIGQPSECTKTNLSSSKVNHKIRVCNPNKVNARPPEFHIPCQPNNKIFRSMPDEITKTKNFQAKHKPRAHPPDKEHNQSMCKHDATMSLFQKLTLECEARIKSES